MANDKNITLTILSGRGSWTGTFSHQIKIADVIQQATVALGYPTNGSYALVREPNDEELDPQRPIVSYHLQDGDTLTLSATGSGV